MIGPGKAIRSAVDVTAGQGTSPPPRGEGMGEGGAKVAAPAPPPHPSPTRGEGGSLLPGFRRRLAAAYPGLATMVVATVVVSPAHAEVCDKMMPDFSSGGGLISLLVFYLPELILAVAVAVALYADARASLIAAVLIAVAYVALYLVGSAGDVQAAARAEGCAAPRFVVPMMFGGFSMFLALHAFRKRPEPRPEP